MNCRSWPKQMSLPITGSWLRINCLAQLRPISRYGATRSDPRCGERRRCRYAPHGPLPRFFSYVRLLPERGDQNAVSDAGVAALLAQAAVRSALLNVDINLRALEDAIYVRQVRAEVDRLVQSLQGETEQIMELVNSKIKI